MLMNEKIMFNPSYIKGAFLSTLSSFSLQVHLCQPKRVQKWKNKVTQHSKRMIGYQLISVCNSSSPDPTIRELCENPNVDAYLDTLFPVIDASSQLPYRNQYCAMCNEYAELDKISRWDMDIKM